MTKVLQIYKCKVCGNIVEVVHAGEGELVCCHRPMQLLTAGAIDASLEKHVPVIEKKNNGLLVKIGSVPHPMEDKHYIEWIELIADGKSYRQFLKPGSEPQAFFEITANEITVLEYCNLHGLWSAEG